jgi:hypothetical protein
MWSLPRLCGHVHLESTRFIPNSRQWASKPCTSRTDKLSRPSWMPTMSNSGWEVEGFSNRHQVNDFKTAYIFGLTHFMTDVRYTFVFILLFIVFSTLFCFFSFSLFFLRYGKIHDPDVSGVAFPLRPGLFGAGFRQPTKNRRSWSFFNIIFEGPHFLSFSILGFTRTCLYS